jgi:MFS family permease
MITAVRYCGGTLAYTSVMVLINAMSPPHVVGLANGLAQSTVSFSRFIGPVIGGAVSAAFCRLLFKLCRCDGDITDGGRGGR